MACVSGVIHQQSRRHASALHVRMSVWAACWPTCNSRAPSFKSCPPQCCTMLQADSPENGVQQAAAKHAQGVHCAARVRAPPPLNRHRSTIRPLPRRHHIPHFPGHPLQVRSTCIARGPPMHAWLRHRILRAEVAAHSEACAQQCPCAQSMLHEIARCALHHSWQPAPS